MLLIPIFQGSLPLLAHHGIHTLFFGAALHSQELDAASGPFEQLRGSNWLPQLLCYSEMAIAQQRHE